MDDQNPNPYIPNIPMDEPVDFNTNTTVGGPIIHPRIILRTLLTIRHVVPDYENHMDDILAILGTPFTAREVITILSFTILNQRQMHQVTALSVDFALTINGVPLEPPQVFHFLHTILPSLPHTTPENEDFLLSIDQVCTGPLLQLLAERIRLCVRRGNARVTEILSGGTLRGLAGWRVIARMWKLLRVTAWEQEKKMLRRETGQVRGGPGEVAVVLSLVEAIVEELPMGPERFRDLLQVMRSPLDSQVVNDRLLQFITANSVVQEPLEFVFGAGDEDRELAAQVIHSQEQGIDHSA